MARPFILNIPVQDENFLSGEEKKKKKLKKLVETNLGLSQRTGPNAKNISAGMAFGGWQIRGLRAGKATPKDFFRNAIGLCHLPTCQSQINLLLSKKLAITPLKVLVCPADRYAADKMVNTPELQVKGDKQYIKRYLLWRTNSISEDVFIVPLGVRLTQV